MMAVFKHGEVLLVLVAVVAVSAIVFNHVYGWSPPVLNVIYSEFPELRGKNITYVSEFVEGIIREFNETDPHTAMGYQKLLASLNRSVTNAVFESLGDQLTPFSITFTHIIPLILAVVFVTRLDKLVSSGIYGMMASARGSKRMPWFLIMREWGILVVASVCIISAFLMAGYVANDMIRLAATPERVITVLVVLSALIAAESLVLALITTPLVMNGKPTSAVLTIFIYSIVLGFILPFAGAWFLPAIIFLRPADSAYFILSYAFYVRGGSAEMMGPTAQLITEYALLGAISLAVLIPALLIANAVLINRKDIM